MSHWVACWNSLPEKQSKTRVHFVERLLFREITYMLFMYICEFICTLCTGTRAGQERVSWYLALQLQMAVSCLMWMLGTKLEFKPSLGYAMCSRTVWATE